MTDLLTSGLVLPAILLAALGWLVPWGLGKVFPEGVAALMLLGFVATVLMFLIAMGFFFVLYLLGGVPVEAVAAVGALWHFGRLALMSALLWGPILILSVANLPRSWTEVEW